MHEAIEDYIGYLRAHGRKAVTVEDYIVKLDICLDTLGKDDPRTITAQDLLRLRSVLAGNEATVRAKLTVLDRWIRWSTGRGVLAELGILWNRPQRHRVFITTDEYRALLQAAEPWERIVLVLGGMMGLRRAEMLAVRLEDVGTGSIRIHGKGHGVGLVTDQPMAPQVRAEIDRWMAWRAQHGLGGPWLVTIPDGRGGECLRTHLDVHLSRTVHLLGQRCGVEVTTHSLRRYYATGVYRLTDHDIDLTRRLMRHADAGTTLECYIQPEETAMCQAVRMIADVL